MHALEVFERWLQGVLRDLGRADTQRDYILVG